MHERESVGCRSRAAHSIAAEAEVAGAGMWLAAYARNVALQRPRHGTAQDEGRPAPGGAAGDDGCGRSGPHSHGDAGCTLAGRLIAAQEEERRWISLELHDSVSQRIAVTCIALERLKGHLADSNAEYQVDLVLGVLTELAEGVRRLSHAMHPSTLSVAGLGAALRGHCDELRALARLEVELELDDLPPIPRDAELCLYRVAQGALANVVAHAGVRRASLRVSRRGGAVELEVSDGGTGFDLARVEPGLGLEGMGERLRLQGGSVSVESRPGAGTVIRALVPLDGPAPPPAREGAHP